MTEIAPVPSAGLEVAQCVQGLVGSVEQQVSEFAPVPSAGLVEKSIIQAKLAVNTVVQSIPAAVLLKTMLNYVTPESILAAAGMEMLYVQMGGMEQVLQIKPSKLHKILSWLNHCKTRKGMIPWRRNHVNNVDTRTLWRSGTTMNRLPTGHTNVAPMGFHLGISLTRGWALQARTARCTT